MQVEARSFKAFSDALKNNNFNIHQANVEVYGLGRDKVRRGDTPSSDYDPVPIYSPCSIALLSRI